MHINLTSKGPLRRQPMPDTLNSLKNTVRAKDKLINKLNEEINELNARIVELEKEKEEEDIFPGE